MQSQRERLEAPKPRLAETCRTFVVLRFEELVDFVEGRVDVVFLRVGISHLVV